MTSDPVFADLHELFWNTEPSPSPAVAVRRWQRLRFHVETVMNTRGLPRSEAERIAYEILLVEQLNATHPDTPSDRCVHCGKPETPDETLRPFGVALRHAWLHSNCWAPWRAERRAKTEDDLARLGIVKPGE
jgi:hypothetical protein